MCLSAGDAVPMSVPVSFRLAWMSCDCRFMIMLIVRDLRLRRPAPYIATRTPHLPLETFLVPLLQLSVFGCTRS